MTHDLEIAAEEALVEARLLKAMSDTLPMGMILVDRTLRILKANRAWTSLHRVSCAEIEGRPLYDIFPYGAQHHALHLEVLAGAKRELPVQALEVAGRRRWARAELLPWRNDAGEVSGMLIMVHDVTDMAEAMRRIERSERRLQMAVALADLRVWEIDYHDRTLDTVGAETIFDRAPTYEDIAADLDWGVHPDDRDTRPASPGPGAFECRARREDGSEVWMSSATEVIPGDDGEPASVVGVMQNITHRKRAERALIEARNEADAANRSKSDFLANMSHEIRTPLNGVLGMAQAIEADVLTEAQRARVKVVRESGTTLLAILNDLLDLSKAQAGKMELNPAVFEMARLAPVVVAAFQGTAAAKDVDLVLEVEDSADGAWVGDILRLRQVLTNLVSNAVKFTASGVVSLSVRHTGQGLIFSVQDSGIGIDPDKVDRLFDRFSQEDASTTRRFGGTGLGLSICQELVDLMGGTISVSSAKGVGSCFSVALPLARAQQGDTLPENEVEFRDGLEPGRTLRVLAAEDNATNQLVLRSLLAPLDMELTLVADGAAAVEAFRHGTFDLVLMDIQMPGMNGLEATRAIRDLEAAEGRSAIQILALSANVMAHQIAEYLQSGMDACIAKPIEVAALYGGIEDAMRRTGLALSAAA